MTQLALRARRRSCVLRRTGIALVLLAGAASAQTRAPLERDLWYAHVDGDQRYGSHHVQVTSLPDGNYRYEVSARVLVDLFASQKQETVVNAEYVVTSELRPVSMRIESGQLSGSAVVTGRFIEDTFTVSVDRAGVSRDKAITIDPAEILLFSVSVDDWLAGLDTATDEATAKVIVDETGEVETVVATRMRSDANGSEWQLDSGTGYGEQVLTLDAKGVLVQALVRAHPEKLVRCTADEARDLTHRKVDGREVLTFPLDREIGMPHRLEELVVKLTWKSIPFDNFELEDARQRVLERTETRDGRSALIEIVAPTAVVDAATIPVEEEAFAAYLAETDYIKPTDPKILAAATEVIGGTTNAAEAAAALSKWVFDFVEGELIAETLSGPEVLACGKGKCTEYSTLFASMARSVGIPTRIVLGERMVAGSWMGHMWNEAWVGRWVTVDASANEVDRSFTLLKFIHSDTVQGTQPLRWALTESLSISIEHFSLRESELAGKFETGIDGVTYTNVDHVAQLTAPSDEWALSDDSEPGTVVITFDPPIADRVAVHFVAFSIPEGTPPKALIDARISAWTNAFDTVEVLQNEPREVHGATGHTSHLQGGSDGDEKVYVTTEVLWIRGPSGYLMKLTGPQAAHDALLTDYEKLIESFRFLDE